MPSFYDALEKRSADERLAELSEELPKLIELAKTKTAHYRESLASIDPSAIFSPEKLASLPVLRKSSLIQKPDQPLAVESVLPNDLSEIHHIFQSPGPIFEVGMRKKDWWRFGRALVPVGIGNGDIIQNCFSYHFTPAGMMFETAAAAVGATVVPAGIGQTELQAQAVASLKVTAYAGTPDYLKAILEKGEELGLDMSTVTKAVVSGGPLFPALREEYDRRGIFCRQCYGTADVGLIAYESVATDGLIIDEGVVVEIVRPGTGEPVPDGEIGEVVVTALNPDFPMIRFATGDLSAILPGMSSCGRTNRRIVGWRGRADQAAKVKGMFVRPEQVAQLANRHKEINRIRLTITHDGSQDQMTVQIEGAADAEQIYSDSVRDILKLRGQIKIVAKDSLPNDGMVIDDQRTPG